MQTLHSAAATAIPKYSLGNGLIWVLLNYSRVCVCERARVCVCELGPIQWRPQTTTATNHDHDSLSNENVKTNATCTVKLI